jgi:hypothetical protein
MDGVNQSTSQKAIHSHSSIQLAHKLGQLWGRESQHQETGQETGRQETKNKKPDTHVPLTQRRPENVV